MSVLENEFKILLRMIVKHLKSSGLKVGRPTRLDTSGNRASAEIEINDTSRLYLCALHDCWGETTYGPIIMACRLYVPTKPGPGMIDHTFICTPPKRWQEGINELIDAYLDHRSSRASEVSQS
jgi:hypothetical protein